jgi:hypothetical protein
MALSLVIEFHISIKGNSTQIYLFHVYTTVHSYDVKYDPCSIGVVRFNCRIYK